MEGQPRYRISVAVIVGIAAEMIIVKFEVPFPGPPERYLGAVLFGALEGISAGWALGTLTRKLRKPKPGIILLTLSGAIILEIVHLLYQLLWCLLDQLSDPMQALDAIAAQARDGAITGAAIGFAIGLMNRFVGRTARSKERRLMSEAVYLLPAARPRCRRCPTTR
jgi:hypothetical protein